MERNRAIQMKIAVVLFSLGFVGVLSSIPVTIQLLSFIPEELPLPIPVLVAISTIQGSILLAIAVAIGAILTPSVSLRSPIVASYITQKQSQLTAKEILLPGVLTGIVGALVMLGSYSLFSTILPDSFLSSAENFSPSWYTRILYGGITEELLMRWGAMTLFVWLLTFKQRKEKRPLPSGAYIIAIVLSSLLFGIGHIPAANLIAGELTGAIISYVVIVNSLFGLFAGTLFWKRGLECAIVAHMTAHVVLLLG